MPAQAGIYVLVYKPQWIPAYAGMTGDCVLYESEKNQRHPKTSTPSSAFTGTVTGMIASAFTGACSASLLFTPRTLCDAA